MNFLFLSVLINPARSDSTQLIVIKCIPAVQNRSVVGKASTIGIEISPTVHPSPNFHRGESKVQHLA